MSAIERAKLTTWLVDQRRAGNSCPEIDSSTIKRVKNFAPLSVDERQSRLMLCLEEIGGGRIARGFRYGGAQDEKTKNLLERLAAWTESIDSKEVKTLRWFAKENGLIGDDGTEMRITHAGWLHIAQAKTRVTPYVQAFVAMWFDPSMEHAYQHGFEPGIRESGYKPMRIDRREHNNKIDDEILAEIRRSKFIVADFTSEPHRPRGGVYFEAGFARGLGLPVVWTCRSDLIDQLHFDTRQFNHIPWSDPADLKRALTNRIVATLGLGPLAQNIAT